MISPALIESILTSTRGEGEAVAFFKFIDFAFKKISIIVNGNKRGLQSATKQILC